MGFVDWFKNIFKKKTQADKDIASLKRKSKKGLLKIGLALSGGGTRGIAYIGVFKALQEYKIDFDVVAGTSVGSLMGAIYCAGLSIDEMIDIAKNLKKKDILSSKIPYVPSKTDKMRSTLRELLGNKQFEDLNKPFTAVAVDIKSGEEVHFNSGPLDTAIAGSCAVPGVFVPVEYDSYRLYDGGLKNNIPADVVRNMGADIVVAFDINPTRGYGTNSTKYLELMKAALRILMKSNSVNGYVHADYVVKVDLSMYSQMKLDNLEDMIRIGYETTIKEMPNILKAIGRESPNEDIKKTAKKLRAIEKHNKNTIANNVVDNEISDTDENEFENFLKKEFER